MLICSEIAVPEDVLEHTENYLRENDCEILISRPATPEIINDLVMPGTADLDIGVRYYQIVFRFKTDTERAQENVELMLDSILGAW